MLYANENLRPKVRNEDELVIDRFVDWYGQQLGIEPRLLCRPDQEQQKGIDGEYELGNIRLLVEHTSLDELPNKRTEDTAFQVVIDAFQGVKLPKPDHIYTLSLPYRFPPRSQAKQVGNDLRAWFDKYAGNYSEGKDYPRYQKAENCSHPLQICVRRSSSSQGRISWSRILPPDADNRIGMEQRLRKLICTCLERKLPKLLAHPSTNGSVRILILQNDEGWRGFKTDDAQFIKGYFHRHRNQICDEIWSLEVIGSELDCVLLWSKALDRTTSKNPFRDDWLSLLELLNIRKWNWQKSRLSQVANQPECAGILALLEKGLEAQGNLSEQDERQIQIMLQELYARRT